MKQNQTSEFTWPLLFFVTAGSFFIFSVVIKLLDGSTSNVYLFFKIGLGAAGLGVIATITSLVASAVSGKDN